MKIAILFVLFLSGCASMGPACTVNYNVTLPPVSSWTPKPWDI